MGDASLCLDVLALVCECLTDVSDVLSFILTSSSLRPIATKHLLSMGPIRLVSSQSMRQFHSFLFADAPTRASYIRALKVEITNSQPEKFRILDQHGDSSLLIDIITSCLALQHLSVVLETEDLSNSPRLTDNPQIVSAIAGIQNLRSLSILGWDTDVRIILRDVRAPLRKLGILSYNIQTEREITDFWFPAELEEVLPPFAPTLEKLELSKMMVDSDEIQGVLWMCLTATLPSVFTLLQYPAIRSLSVRYFMGVPLLDHLQHLFPALDGTLSLGTLDSRMEEHGYHDIRAANLRGQQADVARAWKRLDRVICDGRMLYALGLSCPIRLIMLDHSSVHRESRCYAAEALRENPVPRLKITLKPQSPQHNVFDAVFSPELSSVLTHLTICLTHGNHNEWWCSDEAAAASARIQWADVLGQLLSALGSLQKLTHLRVVVHTGVHSRTSRVNGYSEAFINATRSSTFGFEETAALLVRPLPSLRFLSLTTSGYLAEYHSRGLEGTWKAYDRWYATKAWRVSERPSANATPGGEPVLVELHEEVTETIIRKEELVLSEADEETLHIHGDSD